MKSSFVIKTLEAHRRLIEEGKSGMRTVFEMAISKAHCDMVMMDGEDKRMVLVEKDFTRRRND